MTTTATWKTQITADIPDYGSQEVTFTLSGGFFVGGEDEVLPLKTYTMTLDANGNDDGAFYLPTPDNSGDAAINWRIRLPSGQVETAAIAYNAAAQALSDILASASTTTAPDTITAALAGKLDAANNLSDVSSAATARTNLGLGSAAVEDASAFDAAGSAAAAQAAAIQRANHTGTQTADTISDFDTEVSGNADVTANTSARHTHANQSELDLITDGDHDVRTDNPHAVTAAQVSALALTGGQLSGNLGIGTAPSYTLDVNGTCQNTAQRIVGSAPSFIVRNTSYSPRIDFVMGLDSAGTYLASDTEAKHLRLYTRETGSSRTERMRVQDNGLIGINTASAISQLHVLSMSAATIGQIIQLAASATANALEVRNSSGTTLAKIEPDGEIQAAGYKSSDGSAGWTGTFTNGDGNTVTVKNGLIVGVA